MINKKTFFSDIYFIYFGYQYSKCKFLSNVFTLYQKGNCNSKITDFYLLYKEKGKTENAKKTYSLRLLLLLHFTYVSINYI